MLQIQVYNTREAYNRKGTATPVTTLHMEAPPTVGMEVYHDEKAIEFTVDAIRCFMRNGKPTEYHVLATDYMEYPF